MAITETKLSDVIDEMVRIKTFGLDALDSIKALRDKALAQDSQIEKLTQINAEKDLQLGRMRAQLSAKDLEITDFNNRLTELATRESKVRELEMRDATSHAAMAAYREVFGVIFKNTSVRENATKQLPFSYTSPGGPSNTGWQPAQETVERTTE